MVSVGMYFTETHQQLDHLVEVECINNKGISNTFSVRWFHLAFLGVSLCPEFKKTWTSPRGVPSA